MHDLINQKQVQRHMRVRDPVCGRQLQLAEAAAMLDHHGRARLFCSTACRVAFRTNPDRFADGVSSRRSQGTGDAALPALSPGPRNMTFKPKENEQ
ncbi:MAG: YHS domain-containing protein [Thermohalobaculum sp.]|nr:YHS domain-containing protein [Thermohalobaculum sp.]